VAIQRVCYTTRERVKTAVDLKWSARIDPQIDDAIEAASDTIDGDMNRVFYPTIATRYFDWPNFAYAYPWRLWFDGWELAAIPTSVTSGGVAIPLSACNFEPVNSAPPFRSLELKRNLSYGFGVGPTPQRDIAITGPYGFWTRTAPGGALAAAMADTTGTAATAANGALPGVGDNILIDTERMLVTDKNMITTAQTQQGTGCSSAKASDNLLGVTDGTKYNPGETLLLDAERMQVADVAGNSLTVRRAWDGTVLAAHTGATIYAARLLTVARGALGTAAATHSNAAPVSLGAVPGLIRQLATAYALVDVANQAGAYAQSQGDGAAKVTRIGQGLPALADKAYTAFGRKARSRVV
jgi:hypothetical protein